MVFHHDFNGLCRGLKKEQHSPEWQLFINALQRSLKDVLLHNGNSKHTIPIAHYLRLEETYDNMIIILEAFRYNVYQRTSVEIRRRLEC
jgi:hypothetical protein